MHDRKKLRDMIGFDDRRMLVLGIPVVGILVSMLLFNEHYTQGNWKYLSLCIPISMVYTSVFWLSLRWIYCWTRLYYPTVEALYRRIGWAFIGFLFVFFVVDSGLHRFFLWLLPGRQEEMSFTLKFIVTLLLSAFVITIYEAASFYLELVKTNQEKAELKRHYVQSQLEGLRNQVNPHFLFNSLNTLTYLIPEDADRAVRFVQKLSKVYRYVLESRDAATIPLQEELEYLNAYIYLLRERFGDNFQVDIQEVNGNIVPLTLQILFENAIKHNVMSAEKPLKIEVFPEHGQLIVRNNLQTKNQVMDSTGVGLENIRARYKMQTDQDVTVAVSDLHFTVSLPLL